MIGVVFGGVSFSTLYAQTKAPGGLLGPILRIVRFASVRHVRRPMGTLTRQRGRNALFLQIRTIQNSN
jgi:hypothetical protein